MRITQMFITSCIVAAATAQAQAPAPADTLSLLGRSTIAVGIGLTGARDVNAGVADARTHTSGQIGSFAFTHWVRPGVAVQFSTAVLNADVQASAGATHSNAVIPLLFGLSVSPASLALSAAVRPYTSVGVGPYIHMITDASWASSSMTMEMAPGARVATGVNWFMSRHIMLNIEGDYHAVGNVAHPDALTSKPSGFGASLGFGFAWGGR
jgi:hypothetical protein